MKYFKDILGTFTTDEGKEIMRLCRDVRFKALDNEKYLITYYIKDGDMPETVAYDLYRDSELWWIICMSASIFNVFTDWPMTDTQVNDYFNYLVLEGELTGTASEKLNLKTINDAKRTIKILDPKYINSFIFSTEQYLNEVE